MLSIDFTDRVVLVTGGTKGIGRIICAEFLAAGAHVLTCGRNEPDDLPHHDGRHAEFVAADIRDIDQVDAVVGAATQRWGRLDVLVNNAGGSPAVDAATVSPRFSESIIALNLVAPLHFSQRANAVMQQQQDGGNIVNIGSVSAERPSPGTAAYGAAKAGLLSLTRSLAVEWAPKVRVNAVTCGLILTESADLHYGDEAGVRAVAATVPAQRLGTPTDVAHAAMFLASPLADYCSGSSLLVHGGGERPAFLDAAATSTS